MRVNGSPLARRECNRLQPELAAIVVCGTLSRAQRNRTRVRECFYIQLVSLKRWTLWYAPWSLCMTTFLVADIHSFLKHKSLDIDYTSINTAFFIILNLAARSGSWRCGLFFSCHGYKIPTPSSCV